MRQGKSRSCVSAPRYDWIARGWHGLRIRRPRLRRITELIVAAEFQQPMRIRREFRGRHATHFADDARVIEYGVPIEIRPENFKERSASSDGTGASRQRINGR